MDERQSEAIHTNIRAKYRALDAPAFWFQQEALSRRPYDGVVRRLAVDFAVEEDTDPNYDVAFAYLLCQGACRWRLELSMIGPYAALLRIEGAGRGEIISPATSGLVEPERVLLAVLAEYGLQVLDQPTLTQPIGLRLTNVEPGTTCLYHALFSDVPVLPWHG